MGQPASCLLPASCKLHLNPAKTRPCRCRTEQAAMHNARADAFHTYRTVTCQLILLMTRSPVSGGECEVHLLGVVGVEQLQRARAQT